MTIAQVDAMQNDYYLFVSFIVHHVYACLLMVRAIYVCVFSFFSCIFAAYPYEWKANQRNNIYLLIFFFRGLLFVVVSRTFRNFRFPFRNYDENSRRHSCQPDLPPPLRSLAYPSLVFFAEFINNGKRNLVHICMQ